MRPKKPKNHPQDQLFQIRLDVVCDPANSLVKLANRIDWDSYTAKVATQLMRKITSKMRNVKVYRALAVFCGYFTVCFQSEAMMRRLIILIGAGRVAQDLSSLRSAPFNQVEPEEFGYYPVRYIKSPSLFFQAGAFGRQVLYEVYLNFSVSVSV